MTVLGVLDRERMQVELGCICSSVAGSRSSSATQTKQPGIAR
jgi:hypothetical protein